MRVLLIEDDIEAADFAAEGLRNAGHEVALATTGPDGLAKAITGNHDVAIVDRMLPKLDGLSLVRMLRTADIQTRVIFVTTLGGIDDRVDGLNAGGDDYLVKPFAMAELLARVAALARRPMPGDAKPVLRVGDLELNLLRRKATRAGKAIELQPMEFKLLEALMRQAGRVVTRTMLLEQVWEFQFDPKTTLVETHISRLRSKIDRDFPFPLIETIHGSGYSLRDPR